MDKIIRGGAKLKPLISVGMPVFNEEKYLKESIVSILDQDYENFELIISDNASTDQTGRICIEFAQKDSRIKYIRNRVNIGAHNNFFKVFRKAEGEFFMFAGGHDLWSKNFMSTCMKTLQEYPDTVLSFAATAWIDKSNQPIEKKSPFYDTRGSDPVTRFMFVLWGAMNPMYGLVRMDAMRKVRLNSPVMGGDLIILAELSFMGQFACNPEAIWFRRMQHGEETIQRKAERYKTSLFSRTIKMFTILLYLKIPFELWRSIAKAQLSPKNKLCIFAISIVAFPVKFLISHN
jgi:glycosyltransferase involved in cell wall biosynthesis